LIDLIDLIAIFQSSQAKSLLFKVCNQIYLLSLIRASCFRLAYFLNRKEIHKIYQIRQSNHLFTYQIKSLVLKKERQSSQISASDLLDLIVANFVEAQVQSP
jgi:hypothetical protein